MIASSISRRKFVLGAASTAAVGAVTTRTGAPATAAAAPIAESGDDGGEGVLLRWLDGIPTTTTGTSWGVPWPRGEVAAGSSFALTTSDGESVPVQSWPLAFWPDDSLKWSGHSISSDTGLAKRLRLVPGKPAEPRDPVHVRRRSDSVVVHNSAVRIRIATAGTVLLPSIAREGRVTARNARLVLLLQDHPDDLESAARQTSWTGVIDEVDVEQPGPVRAVVKARGHYEVDRGRNDGNQRRKLLPWTVRIYLGAGAESFRLVHNFVWDGDAQRDFIKGLGLRVEVPMADAAHNRHVRFASVDGGVWGEPVRVLTGLRRDPGAAVNQAQVAGTATPPVSTWSEPVREGYKQLPLWNDFTLYQGSADHFSVWKRTSRASRWLKDAGHGDRASGFGYIGGVSGGLGFGIRGFWQQFPRSLDIRSAATETSTVTLWSWSPYAEAMDLRSYDTEPHGLDLAYEDGRKGFGVAEGIARSTDMEVWAVAATPARERIAELATMLSTPPRLVATPQGYHRADVFGRWSLPDSSTRMRAKYEDAIADTVAFYAGQVEQRRWYGFWNYGDVMHTYDADRHGWRYDVGGYAWDNAELGSDAMLWYAFLRTGDPTAFRLAYAMTRHVSEADTYHAGRFAGLGSRHNVLHWGDGAKEARVGESYTKRFMYYLMADELLGDMLRSSLQADETLLRYPPLRGYLPPTHQAPTRIRIGPDWYALVSNWLTEWERTGETKWRDRIVTGMRDIAGFPAGLFTGESGGAVGFDPASAHLTNLHKGDYNGGYNLSMAFCGDQILWEALDLVDAPEFRQTLVEFARYVQAPSSEKVDHFGFDFDPEVFGQIYSRVTAWAGEELDQPAIRRRGWQKFLSDPNSRPWPKPRRVDGPAVLNPVDEIPAGDISTNSAAQRGLAYIELLAIAPREAP